MSKGKMAVLVAGTWGTALATVLANNHCEVALWSRNAQEVDRINREHVHRKFPNIELHAGIKATRSLEEAVSGAQAIIIASPSAGMREVVRNVREFIRKEQLLIHVAKGFEKDSLKRMTTVIAEELPDYDAERIVVLSGPSHAEEVVLGKPTTVVVAARNTEAAQAAQDLFINSNFRVYTNPDVVGVGVGGALKNIIALGAGLSDGLGFGDNAKAALITRGVAEIARLGVAMGGNALTFAGLAGIGDLVVTCTSQLSRNWRAGFMLAQGTPPDEVLQTMGMVVEGIGTTKAAYTLSRRYDVEMPITEQLYEVLFFGKPPAKAVEALMGRGRTHEIEEIAKTSAQAWMR